MSPYLELITMQKFEWPYLVSPVLAVLPLLLQHMCRTPVTRLEIGHAVLMMVVFDCWMVVSNVVYGACKHGMISLSVTIGIIAVLFVIALVITFPFDRWYPDESEPSSAT